MLQYPRESNWIGSLKTFNVLKITKIFIQHALCLRGCKTCGWIWVSTCLKNMIQLSVEKTTWNYSEHWELTEAVYRIFTIQPRQYSLLQWRTKSYEAYMARTCTHGWAWYFNRADAQHNTSNCEKCYGICPLKQPIMSSLLASRWKNTADSTLNPFNPLTSYLFNSTFSYHTPSTRVSHPAWKLCAVELLIISQTVSWWDRSKTGRLGVARFFEGWFGQSMQL